MRDRNINKIYHKGPVLLKSEEGVFQWGLFELDHGCLKHFKMCEQPHPKDPNVDHGILPPTIDTLDWKSHPIPQKIMAYDPKSKQHRCYVVIDHVLYYVVFRVIKKDREENVDIILPVLSKAIFYNANGEERFISENTQKSALQKIVHVSDFSDRPTLLVEKIKFVPVLVQKDKEENKKDDIQLFIEKIETYSKAVKTELSDYQKMHAFSAIKWPLIALWYNRSSDNEYYRALRRVLHGTVDAPEAEEELALHTQNNARALRSILYPSAINNLTFRGNFYSKGDARNVTIIDVKEYYVDLLKQEFPEETIEVIPLSEIFRVPLGSVSVPGSFADLAYSQHLTPADEQLLQDVYRLVFSHCFPPSLSSERLMRIYDLFKAMMDIENGMSREFQIIVHTLQTVARFERFNRELREWCDGCISKIIYALFQEGNSCTEYLSWLSRSSQYRELEILTQESSGLFENVLKALIIYDYPSELELLIKVSMALKDYKDNYFSSKLPIESEIDTSNLLTQYVHQFINITRGFGRRIDLSEVVHALTACEFFILCIQKKDNITMQEIPWNYIHGDRTEPLYISAVVQGDMKVLEKLLSLGTINVKWAIQRAIVMHQIIIVNRLIAYDKAIITSVIDINDQQPIHVAARYNYDSVLRILLDTGIDVDSKTLYGETALYLASASYNLKAISVLLNAKANPNVKTDNHKTPLYAALKSGYFQVVHALLKGGANPNVRMDAGATVLHYAVVDYHYTDIVAILLEFNADPNIANDQGDTPLRLATEQGIVNSVVKLLEAGANTLDANVMPSLISEERYKKLVVNMEDQIQLQKNIQAILTDFFHSYSPTLFGEISAEDNIIIDQVKKTIEQIENLPKDSIYLESLKMLLGKLHIDTYQKGKGSTDIFEAILYCFTLMRKYCQQEKLASTTDLSNTALIPMGYS